MAGGRKPKEQELPHGHLFHKGLPIRVERLVTPRVARGPGVLSMAVAGVDAESVGPRCSQFGAPMKGVGAVDDHRASWTRPRNLLLVQRWAVASPLDVWQGG